MFAPQQTTDRLSITGLRAWRIKEPVSNRRYTVVRLESRGGHAGYGEGGPSVVANDVAEARAAVVGRRASESEFIRHRLATVPAVWRLQSTMRFSISPQRLPTFPSISTWEGLHVLKCDYWHTWKARMKSH